MDYDFISDFSCRHCMHKPVNATSYICLKSNCVSSSFVWFLTVDPLLVVVLSPFSCQFNFCKHLGYMLVLSNFRYPAPFLLSRVHFQECSGTSKQCNATILVVTLHFCCRHCFFLKLCMVKGEPVPGRFLCFVSCCKDSIVQQLT